MAHADEESSRLLDMCRKVSSTPPIISRTSPVALASCSQVAAVSPAVSANACITCGKAPGEQPTCVSRCKRAKNTLIVSTPTPRLRPKVSSVASTRRVNHWRPSAVSHNQDSGGMSRRSIACVRRCTLLLDSPVCWAMRRTPCLPWSQRHLQIRRLFSQNPLSVGSLKDD